MTDPTVFIARPAQNAAAVGAGDVVIPWTSKLTIDDFRQPLTQLDAEYAGVPDRLDAFRLGSVKTIAVDKLEAPPGADDRTKTLATVARRSFYGSIRETTELLQSACRTAFAGMRPTIVDFRTKAGAFRGRYGAFHFTSNPLIVRGDPNGAEATLEHNREATQLRRLFSKEPVAASLAFEGLPSFQRRTGADDADLEELFTTESANLILARILLLRFLEDHSFFGDHRYMCNGGIQAFQQMKQYFEFGYTRLLEDAYRTAGKVYAAAFSRTELDWIERNDNPILSASIEWSMFQLSRYDFKTVRGDTLTGIYDRFLDRRKRKALAWIST